MVCWVPKIQAYAQNDDLHQVKVDGTGTPCICFYKPCIGLLPLWDGDRHVL